MNLDLYSLLYTSFILLIISAVTCGLVSNHRKVAGWINFLFTCLAGGLLLIISYQSIFAPEAEGLSEHILGTGVIAIPFLIDAFSGFFLAIIAVMGILTALYSIQYLEHYPDYHLRNYYPAFSVFIAGMTGVVTVDDLSIGFTLAWQMMTLSSFLLIRFEYRKRENRRAANKYLILMEIAWLAVIGSTALLGNVPWGATLHQIAVRLGEADTSTAFSVLLLLFFGFAMKAGIFPLGQLWLPDAHSVAPSPISALLSGVMLKTGIYGLIRTFFWMIPDASDLPVNLEIWGGAIAFGGVLTLFIGTVQSMKQSDLKRLLAYSSIGQIGYIVFALGAALFLIVSDSPQLQFLASVSLLGAVYHVLNHAIFKGLLFLTGGSVVYTTGTKDLNKLGGLLKWMPLTGILAAVASLSISGIPPFSGFISKWTIIASSILAGQQAGLLVLGAIIALFTSAITLACYLKYFGMTFTSVGLEFNVHQPLKEVGFTMMAPKVILGLLLLLQGLIPILYFQLLISVFQNSHGSLVWRSFSMIQYGENFESQLGGVLIRIEGFSEGFSFGVVPIAVLLIFLTALLIAYAFRKSGGSSQREVPAWLGGYQTLNKSNVYIDRNMFSAIRRILKWTGGDPDLKNEE